MIALLDILSQIEDPRSYHGREYKLHHVLYIAILAILSKAKTYVDIHRFIKVHFEKLKQVLNLKWRQVPDVSAIRKIIVRTPVEEIERVFRIYSAELNDQNSDKIKQICFDGKTLRGSFCGGQTGQRIFEAFASFGKIILAHISLDSNKESEIPALFEFLKSLDLEGVVVTADAMHCQKKTLL